MTEAVRKIGEGTFSLAEKMDEPGGIVHLNGIRRLNGSEAIGLTNDTRHLVGDDPDPNDREGKNEKDKKDEHYRLG